MLRTNFTAFVPGEESVVAPEPLQRSSEYIFEVKAANEGIPLWTVAASMHATDTFTPTRTFTVRRIRRIADVLVVRFRAPN